jgi:hypothetical protein
MTSCTLFFATCIVFRRNMPCGCGVTWFARIVCFSDVQARHDTSEQRSQLPARGHMTNRMVGHTHTLLIQGDYPSDPRRRLYFRQPAVEPRASSQAWTRSARIADTPAISNAGLVSLKW